MADGAIYVYYAPPRLPRNYIRQKKLSDAGIERTVSGGSDVTGSTGRDDARVDMDAPGRNTGSMSSSSASSSLDVFSMNNPFELRYGRRYLRDLPYPLPCDLAEIQRQNLRTLLGVTIFGQPVCSPHVHEQIPLKVLEIGCGSAYWSSVCHDYFTSLGHPNVSFTGLDIAPLAPDLKKQGLNWTFVQHDFRRIPLPFDDEDFDLIMLKDLSLTMPLGAPSQKIIDEAIRLLREGGTLELWDSDHVLRALLPHPPPPLGKRLRDYQDTAVETGTFLISPGTPFAMAQNRFLRDANQWIQEALDRRKLPPTPCARIAQVLYQEPESLGDVGIRRVAVPLGELRWERDDVPSPSHVRRKSDLNAFDIAEPPLAKGKAKIPESGLTADQIAIRSTALLTVLQMIESLEPLLKDVSGKNAEEWSHWWASMMTDLMDPKGTGTGECLEVGVWWATKISSD